MSSTSSTIRPQRKRTQPSYVDEQPLFTSEEEGDEADEMAKRVNKSKSKARKSKGKGKAPAPETSSDDDELDSSASEAEQPRKKRKKASKKQRKNKKGKGVQQPEMLSSLPVELFTEIVGHCTPGDLLALSRCSKTFRALLISSNSASLWKAARRSVDLPDLTAGDLSELQYAQLVYNTHCELCGEKSTKDADYSLRKRLCKLCRKVNWVDSSWSSNLPSHLQYATKDICPQTYHSASSPEWPSRYPVYAFLPDLEVISKELYAFEGKTGDDATAEPESMDVDDFDEDEELLRELFEDSETEQASNRIRSTRTRQTRRPEHFGYSSVGPSSPAIVKQEVEVEVKAKEGEGEGEKKELGNVDEVDPNAQAMQAQAKVDAALAQKQFKQERKVMRDKMLQDGKMILEAVKKMRRTDNQQKYAQKNVEEAAMTHRRQAIEAKVLALGDYTDDDFDGAWYTSKIVNSPEPLTDENWDATVKTKVIKLLARVKTQQGKLAVVAEGHNRQELLRPRYKKLLDTQPNKQARYAVPLFTEFLQLDSVKPLWEPEDADPEDDASWAEHLDAILEELDDHRISVRVEAVKTILAATTEMTEEELNGDADDFSAENGYDDERLARPVSFLVCNLFNCRDKTWWTAKSQRLTFFGSLPDLLAHQHAHHANHAFTADEMKKRDEKGQVGHFGLPPLVVSALSSVIALAGEKDEEATVQDLDAVTRHAPPTNSWRVQQLDAYLEYENTLGKKRYFWGWRELIDEASQQSERANKQKRTLEVPCIALHDRIADREDKDEARKKAWKEKEKQKKVKQRKREKRKSGRRNAWDYSDDE